MQGLSDENLDALLVPLFLEAGYVIAVSRKSLFTSGWAGEVTVRYGSDRLCAASRRGS